MRQPIRLRSPEEIKRKLTSVAPAMLASAVILYKALAPPVAEKAREPFKPPEEYPPIGFLTIDLGSEVTNVDIYEVPVIRVEITKEGRQIDEPTKFPYIAEVPLREPIIFDIKKVITLHSKPRCVKYDLRFQGFDVASGTVEWKKEDLEPPPYLGYLWWRVTIVQYSKTANLVARFKVSYSPY